MKKIFVTICILISFIFTKAQNFELLNQAIEKSKVIKSGSYKVIKKHKFFDFDYINEHVYEVQFCEIKGTTNCIIRDLKNNNILFFDSSVWLKTFSYKDSILDNKVKFNPNSYLLYIGMQPFGLLKLLPDKINLLKQIDKTTNSNTFKIYSRNENGSFSELDYIQLVIDSNLLIPTTFINYGIEQIDSVNFNIQNFEENIYNVKINNYTEKQFLNLFTKTFNSLPIKESTISTYKQKTDKIDSMIDWNVFYGFKELITGKELALTKEKNLLFFTYLGCIPCKKMLTQLSEIYSNYKNDIEILGINSIDTSFKRILIYKNANNIKFDYYFKQEIKTNDWSLKKLKIKSYPTIFITDKKGKIELILEGYTPNLMQIIEEHFSKY